MKAEILLIFEKIFAHCEGKLGPDAINFSGVLRGRSCLTGRNINVINGDGRVVWESSVEWM